MDVTKRQKKKLLKYLLDDRDKKLKKYLKKEDIPVNSVINDRGEKMVHIAAREGSADCLQLLIEQGARPNLVDLKGNLPLHRAIEYTLSNFSRSTENNLVATLLTYASTEILQQRNQDGNSCKDLLKELNDLKDRISNSERRNFSQTHENDRDSDDFEYSDKKWKEKLAEECDYEYESRFGRYEDDGSTDVSYAGTTRESFDAWADRIYWAFSERRKRMYGLGREETSSKASSSSGSRAEKEKKRPSLKPNIDSESSRKNTEKLREKKEAKKLMEKYKKLFKSEEIIHPEDIPYQKMEPATIIDTMLKDVIDRGQNEIKKKIREEIRLWHPDKFQQKFAQRLDPSTSAEVMERVKSIAQALTQFGK